MRNTLTLSHPTYVGASGATAAATYAFFTKDYKPPNEQRAVDTDTVINQNGKFKYLYDNGPGFRVWDPFTIACENIFRQELGIDAATQYARLRELWEFKGAGMGMQAPEGTYLVAWSSDLQRNFRVFPAMASAVMEFQVVVQFEEIS